MLETALGITAAGWGVVMAVSPLPQIARMLRRRSSDDVSIAYLAVFLPGFMLWAAYGLSSSIVALVVPNTVAAIVATATIVVALRLRHHQHSITSNDTRR